MDYQYITNALLLQILIFTGWSCLLYGLALAATRFFPELVKWSVISEAHHQTAFPTTAIPGLHWVLGK